MIQINPNRKIENNFPDSTPKTATDKFDTIDGGLVNSLTVDFTPIQDLHGYSKPWAGGAGKNKCALTLANLKAVNTAGTWTDNAYERNGITYSVSTDSDGNVTGITLTGTATGTSILEVITSSIPANNWLLTGCPTGGAASTYTMQVKKDNTGGTTYGTDTGTGCSFTLTETVTIDAYIRIESGYAIPTGGIKFYPMLRLASIADPTFEPYSNICPISGHTQVQSKINDTTYTTSLGGTYYGGEVEQVSGVGEATFNIGDLGDINWTAEAVSDGTLFYSAYSPYTNMKNTSGVGEVANAYCSSMGVYKQADVNSGAKEGLSIGPDNARIRVFSHSVYKDMTSAQFKTAMSGVKLVYELATPTALTLTGQNITAEVGTNNVSAPLDGQEIQTDGVTYKEMFSWADVVAYVQSQVNP